MKQFDLPDIVDADLGDQDWDVAACMDRRSEPLHPLVTLWILRTLAGIDNRLQMESERPSLANLFVAVGLKRWEDYRSGARRKSGKASVQSMLAKLLEESECARPTAPTGLKDNVLRLASLVGLSDVDCRVLTFAILLHGEEVLRKALGLLGESLSTLQVIQILAQLLVVPEGDVRTALSPRGALGRSGLVRLDRTDSYDISSKLEILSDDFAVEMLLPDMTPSNLLRGVITAGSPPDLALADYEHIAPSLAVLKPYLANALATGRPGVNVLVHGAPGTGKSQLAKVLAKELDSEIFEVAYEDADGEPIDSEKRLRAIGAAQCFFAQQRALIVFDEVEDVFDDGAGFFGARSTAQTRKGWVNRTLESNSLPTFWLSNSVDCLDPAFIRRFDMVLELRVPPRRQRERIIQNVCGSMLDAKTVMRLAESEQLAPAVIARAAAVVSSIQAELGGNGAAPAIELLVNQTLQAQGHPKLRHANALAASEFYDPALVCADTDLEGIAQGLLRARRGRLCLYGPPGTGKTAYGRWLADQLQVPLHVKRASDLLSMYVGGSEHNVAEAFARAREDEAVLLVDEVDSFLQDRRGAQHSWESTLVNEMLTQMEAFPGILVASTNLVDNLDPASLRRFDIKVKFGYLTVEQAWGLLERYCEVLELSAPNVGLKPRLARLTQLTPGDFALVARQHEFRPLASTKMILSSLETELAFRCGNKTPIGFNWP
jgi:AAA+ superfamily predicted ATPase